MHACKRVLLLNDFPAPFSSRPSQNITFDDAFAILYDSDLRGGFCLEREHSDPDIHGPTMLQVWAKPLSDSSAAVLFLNPDGVAAHTIDLPLSLLPLPRTASGWRVRDIWAHKDLPSLPARAANLSAVIGALDSAFLKLTPL